MVPIGAIQEIAERYLTLGMRKVAECDAVRILFRLAVTVVIAMILQVCVLAFIAYKLNFGNATALKPF